MRGEIIETSAEDIGISSRLLYMVHLLDVLRSAGGTLASAEVFQELLRSGLARQSDVDTMQASGETRFAKSVRFARVELVGASLLDCPSDGVWSLSETGWSTFLTPEEARALVGALRHRRAAKPSSDAAAVAGPTRGPRPASYTATVTRDAFGCTYTYVLRFGEADVWKIGQSGDVVHRLSEVNKHVPHEHLGQQWSLFAKRLWPDAPAAYAMEQQLFRALTPRRTIGERVRCSRAEIVAAWRACAPQPAPHAITSG